MPPPINREIKKKTHTHVTPPRRLKSTDEEGPSVKHLLVSREHKQDTAGVFASLPRPHPAPRAPHPAHRASGPGQPVTSWTSAPPCRRPPPWLRTARVDPSSTMPWRRGPRSWPLRCWRPCSPAARVRVKQRHDSEFSSKAHPQGGVTKCLVVFITINANIAIYTIIINSCWCD